MIKIGFRNQIRQTAGLDNAVKILNTNLNNSLRGLGKRLVRSAHSRMREDIGNEKKSLKPQIVQGKGLNKTLNVTSDLIQAYIDAYGLKKRVFQNYRRGSKIYEWAKRHQGLDRPRATKIQKVRRRTKAKKAKLNFRVVEAKPINTKNRLTKREKTIERAAYLIARSIYQTGIRPSHWNKETLKANERQIIRDISNAITRSANQINKG